MDENQFTTREIVTLQSLVSGRGLAGLLWEVEMEHCNWRDFITTSDDTPENVTDALDKHFQSFAAPGSKCPGCEADLTHILFGTFRWGLIHGHGHCQSCSWPAVAHHFIYDEAGKELMSLRNFVLVAHPDFVTRRKGAPNLTSRR